MTITQVGSFVSAGSGSAVSLTVPTGNIGDLIVITVATSSATVGATGVTGGRCVGLDGGTAWTKVGANYTSTGVQDVDAITTINMWVGVANATSGGSTSATVTIPSGAGNRQIDCERFRSSVAGDVWTIDAVDGHLTAVTPSNTTMSYPTLAPSSGFALYVGYAVSGNGGNAGTTTGVNAGFIKTVDTYFSSVRCYNLNVTGSVSPTCTQDDDTKYTSMGALLKAGPAASAPTVGAGLDAEIELGDTFNRTATETANGATITSRSWKIILGPTGSDVGSTISTAAAVSWTPTIAGPYSLRYSATNSAGTGTDTVQVTVAEPPVRMYLTASPSPLPDVHKTFWDQGDQVGDYVARSLALAPSGSASSVSGTETHAAADWWVLLGVWVSPPLAEDSDLTGPFTFVRGRMEDPAGSLLRSHLDIYAVTRDGASRTTVPEHNSSSTTEWPTTPTGQQISGTLAPGSCLAGDRLVFELGFEAQNEVATPATGTIWFGGTGSPDLASGDTDMSRPAWIEFPGPLSFEREEAPTVSAGSDATITLGATFTRTATTVDDGGQTITSRVWQIVSGPDVGTTIGTAAALSWEPELGGVYVLRYLATNSGGTGADDVTVTVNDPSDAPTVSAGPDAGIAPGDTFTRTATEDDGGSAITSRQWLLVSGPE